MIAESLIEGPDEWVLVSTRDDNVTLWKKTNSHWWAVCPPYSGPEHSDSFICPRDRAELDFYGA